MRHSATPLRIAKSCVRILFDGAIAGFGLCYSVLGLVMPGASRRSIARLKCLPNGTFMENMENAPILSPVNRIIGLESATLAPTTRLYVREDGSRRGHIVLGPNVYLGRNAELSTTLGGSLFVGEDTSIQDNCVFQGDISIGASCLFAANVLAVSTIHRFRDNPSWLIRDQDRAIGALIEKPDDYNRPVAIEDDCWIGWGAVIMPGVTIGRGAIIGANSVVTKDVGPYEIHGGAPNRLLGKRLDFMPSSTISAENDSDIPYFYRGFRLSQSELRENRGEGIRCRHPRATLVLAAADSPRVRIEGTVLEKPLTLTLSINGFPAETQALGIGPFALEVAAPAAKGPISTPVSKFTIVELADLEHCENPLQNYRINRYAIRSARLV